MNERQREIIVAVSGDGRYAIDRRGVDGRDVDTLAQRLQQAAAGRQDVIVIISADALAAHQSVINVLDAARRAGLSRLTFAAQTPQGAAGAR